MDIQKKMEEICFQAEIFFQQQETPEIKKILEDLRSLPALLNQQTNEIETINKKFATEKAKNLKLYQNSPIAYFTLNKAGEIVQLNPATSQMLKFSVEQLLNTSIFSYLSEKGKQNFTKNFQHFFKTEETEHCLDIIFINASNELIYTKLNCFSYIDEVSKEPLCCFSVTDISEKIRVTEENKLLQTQLLNQERLSFAINNSNDGLWDWNLLTNEVFYSPSWKSMLGYTEGELENNYATWENLLNPNDLPAAKAHIEDFLNKKKEFYENEFRMKHKNGEDVYILSRVIKQFEDNNGKIYRIVGMHINTTSLRKAETQIKKLSTAVEQNPATIVITDTNGKIEYVNPKFTEVTGYSFEEACGNNPKILKSGKTDTKVYTNLWQTISTGNTWRGEFINKKKNGEEFVENIVVSPIFDNNHNIVNYIAIKVDITDRINLEKELILEKKYLQTIIETSPTSIWFKDRENTYISVNEAAAKLCGLPKNEIEGKKAHDIFPQESQKYYQDDLDVINTGEPKYGIIDLVSTKNEKKWVQTCKIPWLDKNGYIQGVILFAEDITLIKNTQLALLEHESKLKEAQQIAQLGNWELNILTKKLFWSDEIFRIFECEINEFEPNYEIFLSFVHPDDRQKVNDAYTESLITKLPYKIEHKIVTKHNNLKYVVEKCKTEYNSQGIATKSFGIVMDITEQNKNKNKLQSNSSRLQGLLSLTQTKLHDIQTILNYALNTAVQITNSEIGFIYRYNEETELFTLNSWSDNVLPECKIMEKKTVYQLEKTGIWGEVVRQRKPLIVNDFQAENPLKKGYPEGHVQLKRFLSIPYFENNKIVAVVGVGNKKEEYDFDDTLQLNLLMETVWAIYHQKEDENEIRRLVEKLKISNEEIKKSEEKYRLITENAADVIWILNLNKRNFSYISPSVFTLRGFTAEEAMKQDINEALTPESAKIVIDSITEFLPKFVAEPEIFSQKIFINELQQPCKDGSLIWIETTTRYQFNQENEVEVIGISRNINERKKLEDEIKRQNNQLIELIATKDKFFSIIAHDLKSPFNSILGFLELLIKNIEKYDIQKIKRFVETIYNSSVNTYKLLENLLEWSRSQTGGINFKPEFFILEDLIIETLQLAQNPAKTKNIVLDYDISDSLLVFADRNMIHTVLRNLISNAIKFTNKNGFVTIKAFHQKSHIKVVVIDSGVGISDKAKNKLFKINEKITTLGTEEEKGTGLGLILCKEFVEKNGGEIWVESEINKGSNFIFSIPHSEY